MTISQAALASIYTLTIAKDSSNWIRNPFSVAIVSKDGIWLEDVNYVEKMENRLRDYESKINSVFLACADTAVSIPTLEDQLKAFKDSSVELHREHIDAQAQSMTLEDLLKGNAQRKLPKGPVYVKADFGITVEHDREKIAAARKKFEYTRILGGAGPVIVTLQCGCENCKNSFEREFPDHKAAYGSTVKCDKCGESKILREMGAGAPDDIRLKYPMQSDAQKSASGQ